ncbi:MAG: gamma-glutamyltransferase, partial [Verrucomicrobiales bacterium]
LLGGTANAVAPRKRMLSSMTPTIVRRDGEPVLVAGGVGGSRIITAVLQVIINVIDHEMNAQEAVNFPRMHHQWLPDQLETEPGVSPDTIALLEGMGHRVKQRVSSGSLTGAIALHAQADPARGEYRLEGAPDPRREASAAGY